MSDTIFFRLLDGIDRPSRLSHAIEELREGEEATDTYSAEPEVDGHDICRIEVRPSQKPVYAKGKQTKDFYVRLNNGTRSLDIEDALDYIAAHDWDRR